MLNTYKINYDLLIIDDGRYCSENIVKLCREIENSIFNFYNNYEEGLNHCLEDCQHKIKATWYHLCTIKQEIEEVIVHPEYFLRQQVFQSYPKTEFKDDRLIYEVEAFLFRLKAI